MGPFAKIAHSLKEYGAVPGIQLAHAGRKASAQKPWEGGAHLLSGRGRVGDDCPLSSRIWWRPSQGAEGDDAGGHLKNSTGICRCRPKRALAAGFEWLELHFAHGYLAHEFYSPLANFRTDDYGGSFENRIRFLLETCAAVRKVWPERLPSWPSLGDGLDRRWCDCRGVD